MNPTRTLPLFVAALAIVSAAAAHADTGPARTPNEKPAPPAFSTTAVAPQVRVHLESDALPMELRRTTQGEALACVAPCGEVIAVWPGERFTLGGPGLASSEPFVLSAVDTKEDIRLRVFGGRNPGRRDLGKGLVITGGVTAALGLGVWFVSSVAAMGNWCGFGSNHTNCDAAEESTRDLGKLATGSLAITGVASLAVVAGAVILGLNPPTRFTQAP